LQLQEHRIFAFQISSYGSVLSAESYRYDHCRYGDWADQLRILKSGLHGSPMDLAQMLPGETVDIRKFFLVPRLNT
jgi:hypothetical protein